MTGISSVNNSEPAVPAPPPRRSARIPPSKAAAVSLQSEPSSAAGPSKKRKAAATENVDADTAKAAPAKKGKGKAVKEKKEPAGGVKKDAKKSTAKKPAKTKSPPLPPPSDHSDPSEIDVSAQRGLLDYDLGIHDEDDEEDTFARGGCDDCMELWVFGNGPPGGKCDHAGGGGT